jgi:hypothetical protein
MPPTEPNDEEKLQQQPEDAQTPFNPASAGADGVLDDTHPATDSALEPTELYDEGVSGAAEASEPSSDSAVVDYHPEQDHSDKAG